MQQEQSYRKPYKNTTGGIAVGIFIICIAVAIGLGILNGTWFLPILFVGLACLVLIGSLSSYDHKAIYGGLQGFVWLLGLALCFAIGFWPWILLPLGFSIILGALAGPIMNSMRSQGMQAVQQPNLPSYQPYQPYQEGQTWSPYQQGYPGQPMPSQPVQPGQTYQPVEQPPEQTPVASQESELQQPAQQS